MENKNKRDYLNSKFKIGCDNKVCVAFCPLGGKNSINRNGIDNL